MTKFLKSYPTYLILFFSLTFLVPQNIKAQTCGFGCLGLSGIYGGYTLQEFNADGINNWIKDNSAFGADVKFNKGQGFRVGANFFRAQFDGYFFTAKGFFQFINEEYKSQSPLINSLREEYNLRHNYWGIAMDFGFPLFSVIDLKIIEGGITFLNVELKKTSFDTDEQSIETKIENTKLDIGYYLGSGIIINIVPDYISIEGTATYNFYKVDTFMNENGRTLAIEEGKYFIENKGITTTVQLNLGFPL